MFQFTYRPMLVLMYVIILGSYANAAAIESKTAQENGNLTSAKDKTFSIFLSENEIRERVIAVGKDIRRDYQGKAPIFICVLSGAVMFFTDLVRESGIDCEIDFIKISSYGNGTVSSGNVELKQNLSRSIEGKDVILVEDIIDSGRSIEFLRAYIEKKNPRSISIAALLFKRETAKISFPINYICFEIPTASFLIGYGLDFGQKFRQLKSIYSVKQ